jgi:hypothetical protein
LKEGDRMTVIAQDVFTIAMQLMDETSSDGTYAGYDNDYKKKSWPILTLLQAELADIDTSLVAITDPTTALQLDDRTCLTALPYGLAAHLLLSENESKASFFNARYDELKASIPSSITMIQSIYKINHYEDQQPSTPSTMIDGGSFLDPDTVIYDGGEW